MLVAVIPGMMTPNELSCFYFLQEGETTSDGSFRMCMDPKLLCNSVTLW